MATEIGKIYYELDLNDDKFTKGAEGASKKTGMLKKGFEQAERSSKALLLSLTALAAGAVAFGASSIKAYNASVEASTKLRTNMLNVKGATEENVASLEKLAGQLQAVGVVEDDVIKAGMSQLATFNLQSSTIEKLTPKIQDMIVQLKGHNATAEDQIAINNLVGKVMTGNVGALSRYGVTLDENQKKVLQNGTETERAAMLTKVLAQNYGDVNKELRNTPEGKITALKNRFGDLQEGVGMFLVNALTPVVDMADKWIEKIEEAGGFMDFFKKKFEENKKTIYAVAGALAGALVPALISIGISAAAAVLPLLPFLAIGAAIGIMVKSVVEKMGGWDVAWARIKAKAEEFAKSPIWGDIKDFVVGAINLLGGVLEKLARWFVNLSDTQKKWVVGLALAVAAIAPAVKAYKSIKSGLEEAKKKYDAAKDAIETFRLKVMYAKDAIDKKIKALKDSKAAHKAEELAVKAAHKAQDAYRAGKTKVIDSVKSATQFVKNQVTALKASTLATKTHTLVTKAAALATKAFGVAMAFVTSPIGLIVIAVAALVAIFVVLYKKNEAFRNFVDKTWKAIAGFFVDAFNMIKGVVTNVIDWVKKNWMLLLGIVLGPLALIIIGFIKYKDQIINAMKAVWEGIKWAWNGIVAVVQWAWNNIIKPIWDVIVWYVTTILIPGWKKIFEVAKAVWDGIVTAVKWAWENVIKPLWDIIVWYVTTVLIPAWQMIWSAIQAVWNGVVTVVKWAWENVIKPIWDLIWAYITNVLIPTWQTIWNVIKLVWEKVSGAIQTAWDFIKPIFEAVWNYITGTLVPVFQTIWDKVRDVFTNVWNKISTVISNIKAGFDKVKGFISDVVDAFKKIPEKIKSALSGAKNWLVDAGKNIVQGLIDGAGKLLSKLGSFFLDKVPGWIKGPFKKALGIKSPSTVFEEYGVNVNEGLARGILDNTPVRRAMDKLNSFMSSKGTALSMSATIAAQAAGSNVVPITSATGSEAPVENHYHFEMSGVLARSDGELREIAAYMFELVNDGQRARQADEIGDGQIKGAVA